MAGEFELIAKYFRPLAGPEGLGLVDDAACLTLQGDQDLVVTKDLLIEQVHFLGTEKPSSIAEKALAVNLSDLAAKGACPRYYWLGLALPKGTKEQWVADFTSGLKAMQERHSILLAGGDTTVSSGPVVVSITAAGTVPTGTMIRRTGAQDGDYVFVSGTLGDAALGLKTIQGSLPASDYLEDRYLHPQPRVALGQALQGVASACADISDGLLADLGHICEASVVGAEIQQASLPLSEEAEKLISESSELWPSIFAGGDDYELVFTVREDDKHKIQPIAEQAGLQMTCIGRINSGNSCQLVDLEGQLVQTSQTGYQHF